MRRPLNVHAVKEVVRLQSTVLCASTVSIPVINAMDRGRLKKCKRYMPNTPKDKELFTAALLKYLNLC